MKKKQAGKKQALKNQTSQQPISPTLSPGRLIKIKISLGIIITVLSLILYAQTIQHEYTLDDYPVIGMNSITTKGFSGIAELIKTDYWFGTGHDELRGPVYRPTSLIIFAVAWQLSPNNPHLYHAINVLLYAITCFCLFIALCRIFPSQNFLFPFVCTILYCAHPIHTEVVNSIKSLDEILCFLFAIISVDHVVKYATAKKNVSLLIGGMCFFLSLASKETGITFLVIIPLILYFFTNTTSRNIGIIFLLLAAITGGWLLIRMAVFQDLPQNSWVSTSVLNNSLNAAPNMVSRYATIFYILLRYLGLLIFPHPLTCDYNYDQIKTQTLGDPAALIGFVVYLALLIYAVVNFKKKSIIAFGILYFIITLSPVSNIFFIGGSPMAERFMYIPSLGFCMILTHLLIKITHPKNFDLKNYKLAGYFPKKIMLPLLVITSLYSGKVFSRNTDWKNNVTIFSHDVQISTNSSTAHSILGSTLLDIYPSETDEITKDSILQVAIDELKKGIEISATAATYSPMNNFHLGRAFMYKGDYQNAILNFEDYVNKNPNPMTAAYINLGSCFNNIAKYDSAMYYEKAGLAKAPNDIELNFTYGTSLSYAREFDEAIKVFLHLVSLNPGHVNAYYNLGSTYFNKGDFDKGLFYYSKVIELNPEYAKAYYFSGLILRSKGDTIKANTYIKKAASLGFAPK